MRFATPHALIFLVIIQAVCAAFFAADLIADFKETADMTTTHWHLYIESIATLSLVGSIMFETRVLMDLLRRKAHLEASVSVATSAMHDVIESHFDRWRLTLSERDVATFLVKGFGIAEIAALRGNAEGTIKSHLNAIYRKSGTHNRAELLSLIIDGLMVRGRIENNQTAA
ncbi:helix-turn-helix transcriptional regulator [Sedimentitalea nanhaiensis]|uniref:Regulatory protein, luxR family n=1 Tax=Sedimentitalea nanhaiensis TaxID=999627 RepID=A0A1I6YZ65_9RHOB|nr:helix-turn-helix transcriptional regulator [Sedimentitalea nanhaiensis]SFT55749.1 regulatory protein, luxR family [Sedimentitalea nanhaiensis]